MQFWWSPRQAGRFISKTPRQTLYVFWDKFQFQFFIQRGMPMHSILPESPLVCEARLRLSTEWSGRGEESPRPPRYAIAANARTDKTWDKCAIKNLLLKNPQFAVLCRQMGALSNHLDILGGSNHTQGMKVSTGYWLHDFMRKIYWR